MSERAFLTVWLWVLSALVLAAVFISASAQGELTAGHLGFASVMLFLVVIATSFISRWNTDKVEASKSKRQRIDHMLRDMSEEDLAELKQRLSTGDDTILDYLGSDGELRGGKQSL